MRKWILNRHFENNSSNSALQIAFSRCHKDRGSKSAYGEAEGENELIPVEWIHFQSIQIKDNDSLSALLAANIQADLLILMSDVNGIYNKPPWEDGARLMHTYTSQDRNTIEFGKKSKVRGSAVWSPARSEAIWFVSGRHWGHGFESGSRYLGLGSRR